MHFRIIEIQSIIELLALTLTVDTAILLDVAYYL